MASTDPFMDVANGRYPLSENTGAARYWAGPDKVPRPDRAHWWLAVISIVFGLIGADHFWLRSPKTGFLKMITMGGFGLWWLWDIAQILTEKERVIAYGMSTPFDLTTGIAQGMITDQETHYKSKVNYGIWGLSTIFGFLGFDSLFVMKNMGQGLRKLKDGGLVLFGLGVFLYYLINGLPHSFGGWFWAVLLVPAAVFFIALYGTSIGVTWSKTVTKSMGPPEKLMQEGIIFSKLDDNQVNSTMTELMLATAGHGIDRDENLKKIEKEILLLKYGSILPQEFRDKFSVQHISEMKPDEPPADKINAEDASDVGAVFRETFAIAIAAGKTTKEAFLGAIEAIGTAAVPGAGPLKVILGAAANLLKRNLENPNVQNALIKTGMDTVKSFAPAGVANLLEAVKGGPQAAVGKLAADVTGAAQNAVAQAKGVAAGTVGSALGAVAEVTGATEAVTGATKAVTGATKAVTGATNAANKAGETLIQGTAAAKQAASIAAGATRHAELQAISAKRHAEAAAAGTSSPVNQGGGARSEPLSLEGKLMGAATIALIGGGAVKFIIDNLIPE